MQLPISLGNREVKVYKDYEELLNDPQVDAVYIALTHKEWILRSLEHQIPVLSEKPLVLTSTDVDEIQEKVKKTQQERRFHVMQLPISLGNQGFASLRENSMNFGIIGFGRIARKFVQAIEKSKYIKIMKNC